MRIQDSHLSIIEEITLSTLRGLEYLVHIKIPVGEKKNKISISAGDLRHFNLKEVTDLYTVALYLKDKGLDFNVTFDLKNDVPRELHFQGSDDWEEVAFLEGGSIEILDTQIKELISELINKEDIKNIINITYNINIGKFTFNAKNSVVLEGKQKDISDCLVDAGINKKISWDIINDKMADLSEDLLSNSDLLKIKRSINGSVVEINKKTEKYLEHEKMLIDYKDNEYWLQYEVKIDG